MAKKELKLSVNTGAVLIPIDDRGEIIGHVRFNPGDMDIVKRYGHVVESLEAITIPDDATEEDVYKVSEELERQVDYLLNYSVSDEIFAKCNPLSLLENGDFYIESVLEGIASLIEGVMDQRLEKKKAKIRKATAKYHQS